MLAGARRSIEVSRYRGIEVSRSASVTVISRDYRPFPVFITDAKLQERDTGLPRVEIKHFTVSLKGFETWISGKPAKYATMVARQEEDGCIIPFQSLKIFAVFFQFQYMLITSRLFLVCAFASVYPALHWALC